MLLCVVFVCVISYITRIFQDNMFYLLFCMVCTSFVAVVCMCVLLSSVFVCCCRLYVCGVVCVCVSVDNIFIASLNVSIGASSSEMHRNIFLFCNRKKTFETKRLKVI